MLLLAFALSFDMYAHQPLELTKAVTIEVPSGAGVQSLSEQLRSLKAQEYSFPIRIAAKVYGYDKQLKAGEYQIEKGMSLIDVLEKISSGKTRLHRLTLAEGLTTREMLGIIDSNPLLSGKISIKVAEGELLPETYTFAKGTDKNKIIKLAKRAMQNTLHEVWENRASNLPYNQPYDLLIMASIIEKETGVSSERAKVASVFINRLKIGMRLQTDPTVIYALTLGKKDFERSLTRKDLEIDSAFNTYKYAGLPPSPIANPGLRALEAAAHPEHTPYFYFVADGKGGHNFATSLDEHNSNVQKWKSLKNN